LSPVWNRHGILGHDGLFFESGVLGGNDSPIGARAGAGAEEKQWSECKKKAECFHRDSALDGFGFEETTDDGLCFKKNISWSLGGWRARRSFERWFRRGRGVLF
jgi:hypothetical protein